jgi:hypothetical protein
MFQSAVDKNEIAEVESHTKYGVILHRHETKSGSPKNFWYRHFYTIFHWNQLRTVGAEICGGMAG